MLGSRWHSCDYLAWAKVGDSDTPLAFLPRRYRTRTALQEDTIRVLTISRIENVTSLGTTVHLYGSWYLELETNFSTRGDIAPCQAINFPAPCSTACDRRPPNLLCSDCRLSLVSSANDLFDLRRVFLQAMPANLSLSTSGSAIRKTLLSAYT